MSKFQNQLELARWACREATQVGANEARVSVSRTRYVNLSYRDRKIETLEESVQSGLSVSLFRDGKFSAHRTSDLRPEAITKFLQDTVAMTGYLAEDPYRRLPEPHYYADRPARELELVDADYGRVSPEDRHRMARTVEASARDIGGDKVISATGNYYDSTTESATVASNGFEGTAERTDFWCGVDVTARDAGDKPPEEWWWEGGCRRDAFADPEKIGRLGVERALARIGSEKIPTEKMPIIIENRSAGRLLRFMGSAFYARNLQQRQSFLEGKVGQQITSPLLTVTDDPLIPRGMASRLFDDEGISARPLPMIEKGVLRSFYVDTYRAEAGNGGDHRLAIQHHGGARGIVPRRAG
ncbi:MAG: TldD/PmbA family protein [Candidatus Eisenbacteria bacterium]